LTNGWISADMRNFLAALIAITVFSATVAMVNSMSGTVEIGLNFNIQDAAEYLALFIGEPISALASNAGVSLPDQGLIATLTGAFGLAVPSVFTFVLLSR